MSSHREAPEISKDPVADSTDLYAWVDTPGTVTIIANYVPLQAPAGGPNFYEFGDDVVYDINIDHTGSGYPSVIYRFRFTTMVTNPNTFLYNTGPITSLTSNTWNRRQAYTVSRVDSGGNETVLASNLPCPPCNIGPRSTPDYISLAQAAVATLPTGEKVFAGQRADPFWVDLGSIFDLAALRPVQNLHLISMAATNGVNPLATSNVHSIAIRVPVGRVTATGGAVNDATSRNAVIAVWTSASRQKVRMEDGGESVGVGPFHQVSRLGNPLFNEVIVPMALKDRWNHVFPAYDGSFAKFVAQPELAGLLPVLYPGVFPNLAAYKKPRADLEAILLTGIPSGIIPGFQNFTGATPADMLRLNVAIPPSANPNPLGLVGGDAAGFPNGRRLTDNVVSIELLAVAGATIPLVDKSFTPDGAVTKGLVMDGSKPGANATQAAFPYIGTPYDGFDNPPPS
jgi:hypothetical protein